MVELIDTRDLKSLGHCGRVGLNPTGGTNKHLIYIRCLFLYVYYNKNKSSN